MLEDTIRVMQVARPARMDPSTVASLEPILEQAGSLRRSPSASIHLAALEIAGEQPFVRGEFRHVMAAEAVHSRMKGAIRNATLDQILIAWPTIIERLPENERAGEHIRLAQIYTIYGQIEPARRLLLSIGSRKIDDLGVKGRLVEGWLGVDAIEDALAVVSSESEKTWRVRWHLEVALACLRLGRGADAFKLAESLVAVIGELKSWDDLDALLKVVEIKRQAGDKETARRLALDLSTIAEKWMAAYSKPIDRAIAIARDRTGWVSGRILRTSMLHYAAGNQAKARDWLVAAEPTYKRFGCTTIVQMEASRGEPDPTAAVRAVCPDSMSELELVVAADKFSRGDKEAAIEFFKRAFETSRPSDRARNAWNARAFVRIAALLNRADLFAMALKRALDDALLLSDSRLRAFSLASLAAVASSIEEPVVRSEAR